MVWDGVERVVDRSEIRDVAMIITMAPSELASEEDLVVDGAESMSPLA
jgi:hypothetical protein